LTIQRASSKRDQRHQAGRQEASGEHGSAPRPPHPVAALFGAVTPVVMGVVSVESVDFTSPTCLGATRASRVELTLAKTIHRETKRGDSCQARDNDRMPDVTGWVLNEVSSARR
jgi:hypothetical protein